MIKETKKPWDKKQTLRTIDTFSKFDVGDKVELLIDGTMDNIPCKVTDVLYSFVSECYTYSVELDTYIWEGNTRIYSFGKVAEDGLGYR